MKNRIISIASILVFCILFVGCGKLFRYILTDDIGSYTRITFHEMYEQDNIDILIVGSSHCYRGFVPEILDKEIDLNSFNVGTPAQKMDGSLMVIKEAARYNDISHIFLEMYYECAYDYHLDRSNMTSTYGISDYLKFSIDKIVYLLKASDKVYYANSFIVARRNWSKLLDLDYVKDIIVKKNSDTYKNYGYSNITNDTQWYAGKGYIPNKGVLNDQNSFSPIGWENINLSNVSDNWFDSLSDIIEFCDKNNIDLTLVTAPMPNFLIAGLGNYDEYIGLINGIIEGTDVDFYDFNLCREIYFPNTSSLFMDMHHLNCYGAETFSYCLAKLVNGEISPQDMFYSSYSEKLESLAPTVFGVSYHDDTIDDGITLRYCKIVSSDNKDMEYTVSIVPNEGDAYIVQEYSDAKYFVISPDEKGICVIKYRTHNDIETEYEVQLKLP